jgi:proline iminopeptidase
MSADPLYPPIEPYAVHRFAVGDGHELYVEECGRADGIPALFLHGGPGAGCGASHRRFFDPARYRIVLLDQRGSGRSTPHAELAHNTTWDLVADLERVREHLGVERWLVFGGSWGSTLALAYAQTHPERVSALVLRGIFLCRPWEIQWFYQQGASLLFPDYWQDFLAPIPEAERGDLVGAFHRRLTGPDEAAMHEAAVAWSVWEGRCATLLPDGNIRTAFADGSAGLEPCPHRVPLLRQQRLYGAGAALARCRQACGHPGGHRTWPLRQHLPAAIRLGAASRLAAGGVQGHRRRRPCGLRAWYRRCAGGRD